MAHDATVPVAVAVHLDHCPYRDVITECLDAGWNSVLFDVHELDVADNLKQTTEVVAQAHPDGPARRHGLVARPVPRPHRPWLRQGQHLHGDQGGLLRSALEHLKVAEEKNKWDPPTLFAHQRAAVVATARAHIAHIALFGGSGRAW